MATATPRVAKPDKRKARPVPGRASTNFNSSNSESSTTDKYRLQFLIGHCGLSHERSALVSSLIWGGAHV